MASLFFALPLPGSYSPATTPPYAYYYSLGSPIEDLAKPIGWLLKYIYINNKNKIIMILIYKRKWVLQVPK